MKTASINMVSLKKVDAHANHDLGVTSNEFLTGKVQD